MSLFDIDTIQAIVSTHDEAWEERRREMERYTAAYENKFWLRSDSDTSLLIETPDAYGYVESFVASLFSKAPAVAVTSGIRPEGSPDMAQKVLNHWLDSVRTSSEAQTRMALLYGASYLKVRARDVEDVFQRIQAVALPPWEAIVDEEADSWEDIRFAGHVYWMPVHEARAQFGDKAFLPQTREAFLQHDSRDDESTSWLSGTQKKERVPEFFQAIRVVEFYDMLEGTITWWTPHIEDDSSPLKSGPLFTAPDDSIVPPLVPLVFNRRPSRPLQGIPVFRRVYDQIREVNILRTFQANAARKASRQWFYDEARLGPEDVAKIVGGVDGAMIGIELEEGQSLGDIIAAVPHSPTPPEIGAYYQEVKADLDKGSILAPFTRGEATKATATEVTALAAYSSTEIGRLARERDSSQTLLARTYLAMLRFFLSEEEAEPDLIVLDGEAVVLAPDDIDADFRIFPRDNASTPVSEAQRKAELLQLMPTILELASMAPKGGPPRLLLEELVRSFDLPEGLVPDVEPDAPTPPEGDVPTTPGASAAPGPTQAGALLGNPEDISSVLPTR